MDGSQYVHSTQIQCPGCWRQTEATGTVPYSHQVGSATVVRAGSHRVWPLDVEEVGNSDGREKHDGEINAGKRLMARFRREHRQMPVIVTGDDLVAHEPRGQQLLQQRMHDVLVAKPDSHPELVEWVPMLERVGGSEPGSWPEGPACRRRFFEYRIGRQVPLTAEPTTGVTFVQVGEKDKTGKRLYHNSWITDLEVNREKGAVVVGIGRAKWKIETEPLNGHKNHGYELEHTYGHGQPTLSMIFSRLNLLAVVAQ